MLVVDGPVIPCTVGILTFNSADTLERTLASTERFAERIVCDGGSTDGTVALAERQGCRIIAQDTSYQAANGSVRDFAGVMNQMLDAATQPWFFKVDSDEIVSTELADDLHDRLQPGAEGFELSLIYVVDGRRIADATTYPMRQIRVFPVRPDIRYHEPVHERLDLTGVHVERLESPLLLPQRPVRANVGKWSRYLLIEANQARGRGVREWWRAAGRRYARSVRYLTWRYTKVLREGRRPRLPLRYELARVMNSIALFGAGLVSALLPRRRSR